MATLLHKPEFKQHYLSPIRTLKVEDQCHLLQRVISNEITLSELQREANRIKQKIALKAAFTTLTNVDSWDEAMDKFPHFTTDEHLDRFMNVDIRKNIPKTFADFCQRAKNCTSGNLQSNTTRLWKSTGAF